MVVASNMSSVVLEVEVVPFVVVVVCGGEEKTSVIAADLARWWLLDFANAALDDDR